jgi:hypothetical protein
MNRKGLKRRKRSRKKCKRKTKKKKRKGEKKKEFEREGLWGIGSYYFEKGGGPSPKQKLLF